MKKQLVRQCAHAIAWGLLFSLWLGLSACSGEIQGKVFFDENNNGTQDTGEKGVPFAQITVKKDNETLTTGFTRMDGSFELSSKGGTYLFSVDTSSIDFETALRQASPQTPPKTKPEEEQNQGQSQQSAQAPQQQSGSGLPDFKTSSLVPEPTKPAAETGTAANTVTDSAASQDNTEKDGQKDSDQTKPDSTSGSTKKTAEEPDLPDGWTDQGFRVVVKKASSKRVAIPILVDWEGSAEKHLDTIGKQTCTLGTPCNFSLVTLKGCKTSIGLFTGASLSAASSSANQGAVYHPDMNLVTIEDSRPFSVSKASTLNTTSKASASSVQPAVVQRKLSLDIASDIPISQAGTFEATLKPTATCGKQEVSLGELSLSVVRDIVPRFTIALQGDTKEQLEATVVNDGKSPLKEGEALITFETKQPVKITQLDADCRDLGDRVQCSVKDLGSGQSQSWKVSFEITPTSDGATDVTIKGSLSIKGVTQPITAQSGPVSAEAAHFTIPALPPPPEDD